MQLLSIRLPSRELRRRARAGHLSCSTSADAAAMIRSDQYIHLGSVDPKIGPWALFFFASCRLSAVIHPPLQRRYQPCAPLALLLSATSRAATATRGASRRRTAGAAVPGPPASRSATRAGPSSRQGGGGGAKCAALRVAGDPASHWRRRRRRLRLRLRLRRRKERHGWTARAQALRASRRALPTTVQQMPARGVIPAHARDDPKIRRLEPPCAREQSKEKQQGVSTREEKQSKKEIKK